MKKITILLLVGILNIGCQAQDKKKEDNVLQNKDSIAQMIERPKGSWKVNRDYDENGNLIGYDSIYTWSSDNLENISPKDRDSTLQSMESRFYSQYSQFGNQGFNDLFAPD